MTINPNSTVVFSGDVQIFELLASFRFSDFFSSANRIDAQKLSSSRKFISDPEYINIFFGFRPQKSCIFEISDKFPAR